MKTAFHITFYYSEKRLPFLRQVIEGLNTIPGDNTIFIYTNKNISPSVFNSKSNIRVVRFFYNPDILKPVYKRYGMYPYEHWSRKLGFTWFIHPYYLTWESRNVMQKVADDFDVQVYLEDDILFTDVNFKCWLEHKDLCLKYNYNPGFLRYEVDSNTGEIFYSDLTAPIDKVIYLEGKPFLLNDNSPYYAFWIMDKQELKSFIKSPDWNFVRGGNYGEREIAAVGWHGLHMKRYTGTILPLVQAGGQGYRVDDGALVHHLPNSYIGNDLFCKVKHPLKIEKSI